MYQIVLKNGERIGIHADSYAFSVTSDDITGRIEFLEDSGELIAVFNMNSIGGFIADSGKCTQS